MGKLIDILEENDIKKRINGITNLYEQIKSDTREAIIIYDDISMVINKLDIINEIRIWNSLWSIFLLLPKNDLIVAYCEKVLIDYKHNGLHKKINHLLSYLFINVPKKREQLLKEFLSSEDITLKFTATEELASTDLKKALFIMIDIYESINNTFEYDIADAIDLWICNYGDMVILNEIEKRKDNCINEKLRTKYEYWEQNIKTKFIVSN